MKWNRPESDLNLREAKSLNGLMNEDGESLYIAVGKNKLKTTKITVTDDGLGPTGFYTRVIAWSDEKPIWEGPLHNLEGVFYA